MLTASATEVQNNFGRFLQLAMEEDEVIILKNGKEVARIVSRKKAVSFLTDSLQGVIPNDFDEKAMRAERVMRHEGID